MILFSSDDYGTRFAELDEPNAGCEAGWPKR
jgi:hypothetical protein